MSYTRQSKSERSDREPHWAVRARRDNIRLIERLEEAFKVIATRGEYIQTLEALVAELGGDLPARPTTNDDPDLRDYPGEEDDSDN